MPIGFPKGRSAPQGGGLERDHGLPVWSHVVADEVTDRMEKYAALDFEASSLSADSWPIEVGLSWLKDDEVMTWSSLIQPATEWPLSDWSRASEQVHGIALQALLDAPASNSVAAELNAQLAGRTLVSDAPESDGRWLGRLLKATNAPSLGPMLNFHQVNFHHFQGSALDRLYERLERLAVPHKAGPDSARMAKAWQRAIELERDHGTGL